MLNEFKMSSFFNIYKKNYCFIQILKEHIMGMLFLFCEHS